MFALILSVGLAIQPFTLQGFFTIFGTIRDEEGRLVSSVRVSLVDENYQPKGTVFADSSGHYQFRITQWLIWGLQERLVCTAANLSEACANWSSLIRVNTSYNSRVTCSVCGGENNLSLIQKLHSKDGAPEFCPVFNLSGAEGLQYRRIPCPVTEFTNTLLFSWL